MLRRPNNCVDRTEYSVPPLPVRCRVRESVTSSARELIEPESELSSPRRVTRRDLEAPHRSRRDREEVRPVLPRDLGIDEAQVGLIDERGGLKGVIRRFAPHVAMGDLVQLGLEEIAVPAQPPLAESLAPGHRGRRGSSNHRGHQLTRLRPIRRGGLTLGNEVQPRTDGDELGHRGGFHLLEGEADGLPLERLAKLRKFEGELENAVGFELTERQPCARTRLVGNEGEL